MSESTNDDIPKPKSVLRKHSKLPPTQSIRSPISESYHKSSIHEDRHKPPKKCLKIASHNWLLILTAVGMLGGVGLGLGIQFTDTKLSKRQSYYLKFPGVIFIRMLKMTVIPLVSTSIIHSVATLDKAAGKIGGYAFAYYISTTLLAILNGIAMVSLIQPGHRGGNASSIDVEIPDKIKNCFGGHAGDTIIDLVRNLFPDNLIGMTVQQQRTCYKFKRPPTDGNSTKMISLKYEDVIRWENDTKVYNSIIWTPTLVTSGGTNILGIVFFCIVFGAVLGKYSRKCQSVIDLFCGLEYAFIKLITLIVWYTPIGVLFLIGGQLAGATDLMAELKKLGWYMVTVLSGLGIHSLIVLPLILFIVGRRNPFKYMKGLATAMMTALGTSSSSATIPVTMQCIERENGIDERVSRFMIPVGATINMDGTALYEAVACLYIAQYLKKDLSVAQIFLTSFTATIASVGAAGIPSAGLVTMIMVLTAVNLPAEYFILIVPVDFILDRVRTMINVQGDAFGAGVVQRLCRKLLDRDHDRIPGLKSSDELPFEAAPANTPHNSIGKSDESSLRDESTKKTEKF